LQEHPQSKWGCYLLLTTRPLRLRMLLLIDFILAKPLAPIGPRNEHRQKDVKILHHLIDVFIIRL